MLYSICRLLHLWYETLTCRQYRWEIVAFDMSKLCSTWCRTEITGRLLDMASEVHTTVTSILILLLVPIQPWVCSTSSCMSPRATCAAVWASRCRRAYDKPPMQARVGSDVFIRLWAGAVRTRFVYGAYCAQFAVLWIWYIYIYKVIIY